MVRRLTVVVWHLDLYRMQFEQTGLSMSHLIFLTKHKSQARSSATKALWGRKDRPLRRWACEIGSMAADLDSIDLFS